MCSAFICFCLMFLQPEKILHIIAIMFASDVQIYAFTYTLHFSSTLVKSFLPTERSWNWCSESERTIASLESEYTQSWPLTKKPTFYMKFLPRYQHSCHLVTTLNQFTDVKADLPKGCEKKLNKEGKVSHDHNRCTHNIMSFLVHVCTLYIMHRINLL